MSPPVASPQPVSSMSDLKKKFNAIPIMRPKSIMRSKARPVSRQFSIETPTTAGVKLTTPDAATSAANHHVSLQHKVRAQIPEGQRKAPTRKLTKDFDDI